MLFQNETVYHIETQHAETRVIKGSTTDTAPKRVSFWGTQRKTASSDPITPRPARSPRATLTDKV